MKLLLTSNGIADSFQSETLAFLEKNPSEVKLAFITTAGFGEGEDISWLDGYRIGLHNIGISNIVDIDLRKTQGEELFNLLKTFDVIFVNGGNTFYLLHYTRESGFDKMLPKLLDSGIKYIGVSAGSILLCPTIESAGWEPADVNSIGLTDFTGLNLVPFLITPHYFEEEKEHIQSYKKTLPIIGLTDNQAILVEDKEYKIIGDPNYYTF